MNIKTYIYCYRWYKFKRSESQFHYIFNFLLYIDINGVILFSRNPPQICNIVSTIVFFFILGTSHDIGLWWRLEKEPLKNFRLIANCDSWIVSITKFSLLLSSVQKSHWIPKTACYNRTNKKPHAVSGTNSPGTSRTSSHQWLAPPV